MLTDLIQVVILELALLIRDRPDVVIDLSAPGAVENLQKQPFTIKEGCNYRMKVKFRVQHEVISGLWYLQKVSRKKITVENTKEMMVCVLPVN